MQQFKLIHLCTVPYLDGMILHVRNAGNGKRLASFLPAVCPAGPVGEANIKALERMAPELLGAASASGEYDADMILSRESFDAMYRAISGLADYPVIDEVQLVLAELRQRDEWWENYGCDEVHHTLYNAALEMRGEEFADKIELRFTCCAAFERWASARGVSLSEKSMWDSNGDLSINLEWLKPIALEMWANRQQSIGVPAELVRLQAIHENTYLVDNRGCQFNSNEWVGTRFYQSWATPPPPAPNGFMYVYVGGCWWPGTEKWRLAFGWDEGIVRVPTQSPKSGTAYRLPIDEKALHISLPKEDYALWQTCVHMAREVMERGTFKPNVILEVWDGKALVQEVFLLAVLVRMPE